MACIFCKIAAGEIPSVKIIENEAAVAFLDVKPLVRGHVLVIPKRHADRYMDLTLEDSAGMDALVRTLTRRIGEGLRASGVTIAVNDGRSAGQEVPHVHVHLIPRHEGDQFGPIHRLFAENAVDLKPGELEEIGALLGSSLLES